MIEFAGLLYGLAKDLAASLKWAEEDKVVHFQWPEESGFASEAKAKGYQIRWTKPDLIESRRLEGFEVLYEVDEVRRVRSRLILRDGLTLMVRKFEASA
jgi:hypothetical protein